VLHLSRTTQRLREDFLSEARKEVTCIATRIGFDKQKPASFYHERGTAESPDLTTEELLELSSRSDPCHPVLHRAGKHPHATGGTIQSGEQPTDTVKDLSAVRPSDHEAKEPTHVVIREPNPLLHILAELTNLALDHITQTETPRDRLRRIFLLKHLRRQIHVPHDLEEAQSHHSLNPTTGFCAVRGVGRGLRQRRLFGWVGSVTE
jgi:hypothetical protein